VKKKSKRKSYRPIKEDKPPKTVPAENKKIIRQGGRAGITKTEKKKERSKKRRIATNKRLQSVTQKQKRGPGRPAFRRGRKRGVAAKKR